MTAFRARPLLAAALSTRLVDVERGLTPPIAAPGARRTTVVDPEEALREVMVRHLPQALSITSPERRSRVCELLLTIAGEAGGIDLRFLDAFNAWFERVDASWTSDAAWQQVKIAYAGTLRAAISRLQDGSGSAASSLSTANTTTMACGRSQRLQNSHVLVLADHWAGSWRILRELRGCEGVTLHTLICNNTSTSPLAFAIRQAAVALKSGREGLLALVSAAWNRRVRLTTRRLHDAPTLEWLRTERFWLGLHAMAVIYRQPVFALFSRGILNAHIGLLPEYRGRSVMEWSILSGAPTGISVFFMDAGIDTGREIVVRRSFDVSGAGGSIAAKSSLFRRDGEMYRAALDLLLDGRRGAEPVNEGGRRYFVMSGLLTTVVDGLLESAAGDLVWETHACTGLA